MSDTDTYPVNDDAYAQLVAYLDGELDGDGSRQVEERLARDTQFRLELQRLQQTWDLLDELPRADVGTAFTQTTVEVVALSAERELHQSVASAARRHVTLWAITAATVIGVAAISYATFSMVFAKPTRQVARDFPIIDNIELYSVADSVDFLHQLDDQGLFAEEEVDDGL